jgi:hypothetical protein
MWLHAAGGKRSVRAFVIEFLPVTRRRIGGK